VSDAAGATGVRVGAAPEPLVCEGIGSASRVGVLAAGATVSTGITVTSPPPFCKRAVNAQASKERAKRLKMSNLIRCIIDYLTYILGMITHSALTVNLLISNQKKGPLSRRQ
jgi:hypothetical protein